MKILEDRLLIRRFKTGDSDALQRIYEKYRCSLLKLAVVMTNDINCAEDVVHEVFLNFARSISQIKPRGNLKSYLATSVANQIRNIRRNTARRQTSKLTDNNCIVSVLPRPEQWATLSEQLIMLSNAMTQLPEKQREAVALRIEAGMSFKQIAVIQKVPANTTRGRYRYGIKRLRSILDGKV